MEKVAIYGGSFDPPHNGHKLLAQSLAKSCGADKVIIIPAAMSPFKNQTGASPQDRFNMCKLLFEEPLFEVSDIEINRGGKSYTIDTVKAVKSRYPEAELFLFMGDDMLLSFNKWYKYDEIAQLCTIVAGCRTENLEKLQALEDFKNKAELEKGVIICNSVPVEISSTQIRNSIKQGCTAAELSITPEVYDYIKSRGLYRE